MRGGLARVPRTGQARSETQAAFDQALAPFPSTPLNIWRVEPKIKLTIPLILVYTQWVVVIFQPQWFLAAHGLGPALKLPLLVFLLLALLVAIRTPLLFTPGKPAWFPPYAAYVGASVLPIFMALNRAYGYDGSKKLALYLLLAIATAVVVRTPRQVMPIVMLFVFQYVVWGVYAVSGRVPWHPVHANFDGFGPLMVMGMGICYYSALATKDRRLKWICFGMAALAVLGIVTSFARGAVFSAGLVALILWFRSPRKVATGLAGVFAVAVVLVATSVLHPQNSFWLELQSAFTEGTKEGTGEDRWVLWRAALEMFARRPLVGLGLGNFGPNAASYYAIGELGSHYSGNPLTLYDRNLHSVYFQTLAEMGILGSAVFIWLIVDFFRRNAALRRREFCTYWEARTGGAWDLAALSRGIEVAMVGFLITGVFYAQLLADWMHYILALNFTLYLVCLPPKTSRPLRAHVHR